MNLYPLKDPFQAEKLAKVFPALRPYVEDEPRLARLNYFPGRHLTDVALQSEQEVRTSRLRLRAQAVTPGIVSGLEAGLIINASEAFVEVSPGSALARSGEDVVLNRTVRSPFSAIRFYDPTTDTFSEIGGNPGAEPSDFAAVLVLMPGFIRDTDIPLSAQVGENGTDFRPCDRIPEDEVYYRTTVADASRLVLSRWPGQPLQGDAWRNRLAWTIFDAERAGSPLPWEKLGIPIALVAFDNTRKPLWIDRHAVARRGGIPRIRVLRQSTGEPRLWNAQFDQFCAELAVQTVQQPANATFQRLPPAGALPVAYIEFKKNVPAGSAPFWSARQDFFPNDWLIDFAPVPVEQLDGIIASARTLAPYDLRFRDSIRLLLPVPQQFFDPDLLKIEVPSPEFQTAIAAFKIKRGEWLAARKDLRGRLSALRKFASGIVPEFPNPDPKQLENPETPEAALPLPAARFGVTRSPEAVPPGSAPPSYSVDLVAEFRTDAAAVLKRFTAQERNDIIALRDAPDVSAEDRAEIDQYLKKQETVQSEEEARATEVENSGGLAGFIEYLEGKADDADRLVDAGFLKVKVDVFRLGQLLANNSLGTQFAASPTLANIIKRQTESVGKESLTIFASQLLANEAPTASSVADTGSTLNLAAFEPSARLGLAGPAGGVLDNISILKNFATSAGGTETVNRVMTLIDGSDLAGDQKNQVKQVLKAAAGLDSKAVAEIDQLKKFSDTYVPDLKIPSHKQLRAIPLDRLQPPLAPKIREEIHDGRIEIFDKLARLGISLAGLITDFVDKPPIPPTGAGQPAVKFVGFHLLLSQRKLEPLSRTGDGDSVIQADESQHFASGAKNADMSIAALRAVEKRIAEYRQFIERCRDRLAKIEKFEAAVDAELGRVNPELEEARQDVAVAQALLKEEEDRLQVINTRREKVLREQVKFLFFHRPRAVQTAQYVPVRRVEPALTDDPVPACLKEDLVIPAELATFRELFRDSPVRWFSEHGKWLDSIDRWDQLQRLLQRASVRKQLQPDVPLSIGEGRYKFALEKMMVARREVTRSFTLDAPLLANLQLATFSWVDLRRAAQSSLTLDQIINLGPASVSRFAARELDNIFKVATCVYRGFAMVPPLIRLVWSERFSQFDAPEDFRDLSRMPRWGQVEFTLRREVQMDVDWLFSRVDTGISEAVALINDLVRIALLLASHAPVDQLITGTVIEDSPADQGSILKIKVDPLRIHRGMQVIFQGSGDNLVRASVEDITANFVSARVTARIGTPAISKQSVVRFSEARL